MDFLIVKILNTSDATTLTMMIYLPLAGGCHLARFGSVKDMGSSHNGTTALKRGTVLHFSSTNEVNVSMCAEETPSCSKN